MEFSSRKAPIGKHHRIVLHFDYDCFYASVIENQSPSLKTRPLGVRQKGILATCNYVARARGVKKLMPAVEATRICPDLVLVNGEDLSPFRDMSKLLYTFLRRHSWNQKVERLGFDEVFMDVTDIVDYNLDCINLQSLSESFFHISRNDPEKGFSCDLTSIAGCVQQSDDAASQQAPGLIRLTLGSHLAWHLRMGLEREFGHTATCGISTSKALSKLVGAANKPRNQTTLLALTDSAVAAYVGPYTVRALPGIGAKTSHLLQEVVSHDEETPLTAQEARLNDHASPASLEGLLRGAGSEKGIGRRIWALLHGIDATEVRAAREVPAQISIENSFGAAGLDLDGRVTVDELRKLCTTLVRRMRVELVGPGPGGGWVAQPRTLRLSAGGYSGRVSRSRQLPGYACELDEPAENIADRLVGDAVLPLLARLRTAHPEVQVVTVINVAVTGMQGQGQDIRPMLRRCDVEEDQNHKESSDEGGAEDEIDDEDAVTQEIDGDEDEKEDDERLEDGEWNGGDAVRCRTCGRVVPRFAVLAHHRYHDGEKETSN